MRTLMTVTYGSQVDGRHCQKDIDLLTGTCDFILYLPPALLSLFSRANSEHWFKAYKESAGKLPGPHHRLTVWLAIKCGAPVPPSYPIRSETIKRKGGVLQCSSSSQPHLIALDCGGKSCSLAAGWRTLLLDYIFKGQFTQMPKKGKILI